MKFKMFVGNDAYLPSVVPPWPRMRLAGAADGLVFCDADPISVSLSGGSHAANQTQ